MPYDDLQEMADGGTIYLAKRLNACNWLEGVSNRAFTPLGWVLP